MSEETKMQPLLGGGEKTPSYTWKDYDNMVIFDELNNNINVKVDKEYTKPTDGIKIVIDNFSISEGDPDPEFTATVEFGSVNSNIKILHGYELTRSAGNASGEYDITIKSIDYEDSYVLSNTRSLPIECDVNLTVVTGTLTITKTATPVELYTHNDHSSYIAVPIVFSFNNRWHYSSFDINDRPFENYLISGYDLSNLDNQLSPQSCEGVVAEAQNTATGSYKTSLISISKDMVRVPKDSASNIFFYNNDFEYSSIYFDEDNACIVYELNEINGDKASYCSFLSEYIPDGTTLHVEMINIICRYIIAIKFNGTGFNKIINPYCRMALTNMASTVKVYSSSDIEYSGNTNILIKDVEFISRENNKINAIMNTYGISSDESRQNILSIDLMLFPHTIKTFEFDVTDQLTAYPRGGIITVDIDEDL